MVAGLVVSIDGGLKLTARTSPESIIARGIRYSNEHTPKGIELAFRKTFRGGRGTRGGLLLPGFEHLAQ
jgi:hypothetical protein